MQIKNSITKKSNFKKISDLLDLNSYKILQDLNQKCFDGGGQPILLKIAPVQNLQI